MVSRWPAWGWRRSALRAAVLLASYSVVASELLSLANAIHRIELVIIWAFPTLAGLAVILRNRSAFKFPPTSSRLSWTEIGLSAGIIGILGLTAIVAFLSPPQTWDSLNYHMPRVAHWAQNGSLQHFATGIEVQNSRTPAAEILMLNVYVLTRADTLVNFVQWSAMLFGLVGVALVTKQLGAKRPGQLFAALFAATLPMGIVQASSTINDYVVAALAIAVASEALNMRKREASLGSLVFFGLAGALAIAVKPTAIAYLLPFAIYAGYLLLKLSGWRRLAKAAVIGGVCIIVLNLGHLTRNFGTYDSPLNPSQVRIHSNELRTPSGVISNLLRQIGLHAGTPSPHINKAIALLVGGIHDLMKLDVNDSRTTAHGVFKIATPTTNEDQASNPLHAYLLLAFLIYAVLKRPAGARQLLGYATAVLVSLLIISFLFKWQIFASRYHLGFFVLAAPIVGALIESPVKGRLVPAFGALLVLAALPWLVQIKSRPIIASSENTYVGSILSETRERLYLANGPHLLQPYNEIAERILAKECDLVGILLSGNAAEYPLWTYLGAPFSGVEIHWIIGGTPSAKYFDESFAPCAVVCENCPPDQARFRGLAKNDTFTDYQLFLGREGEN